MQCTKKQALRIAKDWHGWRPSPSTVFCLYAEAGKSQIHNCQYYDAKTCARVVGFNVNSLYLNYSEQEMPCGKEQYIEVERPEDLEVFEELCIRS